MHRVPRQPKHRDIHRHSHSLHNHMNIVTLHLPLHHSGHNLAETLVQSQRIILFQLDGSLNGHHIHIDIEPSQNDTKGIPHQLAGLQSTKQQSINWKIQIVVRFAYSAPQRILIVFGEGTDAVHVVHRQKDSLFQVVKERDLDHVLAVTPHNHVLVRIALEMHCQSPNGIVAVHHIEVVQHSDRKIPFQRIAIEFEPHSV